MSEQAAHPVEPAKTCTCDPGPEGQHRYWCDLEYGAEGVRDARSRVTCALAGIREAAAGRRMDT